ncbi:MAG: biosynthetic arginine decarboxylase [Planctomycetota bacterium]|jgi:arginine decarboxylase
MRDSRAREGTMPSDPTRRWSIHDALETYGVTHWGKGYFGVNASGHVTIHPDKDEDRCIDLLELVRQLVSRDIRPPVLIRFTDLLRHRVKEIAAAFRHAIDENQYRGEYCCVYPIKVNQQRHVVEEIRDLGAQYGFGLEAGSKAELLAVLALGSGLDVPVICNGFKDAEFIQMALLAQKTGRRVIPVVEKRSELELIVGHAEKLGVRPLIGMRVKLSARGAGRWELSGGVRSKFGLFIPELIDAHRYLEEHGLSDCLKLLHFHLGSQITNIRNVKAAVTELARVYVQLKLAGAGLEFIDIGGGLGVDYDGSQTNFESSMNYTLEEYASDVVFRIMSVCDEEEVDHPTIVSESGRAMVAYHSVLVFDVLGVSRFDQFEVPEPLPEVNGDDAIPQPLYDLYERHQDINVRNCIEYFHDAVQAYDEALNLFNLGYLDLEQRGVAERFFWAICLRVLKLVGSRDHVPEDLEGLHSFLADSYFCNFSIFQSMPDSWAVDHIFPVLPIHRLDQRPTRRGILGDITCDSDGKIDRFTHLREDKHTLELHPLNDEPYFIGAFLIGAYQEILGDLHNLLGDTHAVHVSLGEDGKPRIEHVVPGDTVEEVLGYVQYEAEDLLSRVRGEVSRAREQDLLTEEEAGLYLRFYESGLGGYTYLEEAT